MNSMSTNPQAIRAAQPLVPEWTEEDFDSEAPYRWLYERRDANKFLFQQLLNKAQKRAAAVGVGAVAFRQYWKAYCEVMSPKNEILGANLTDFPDQPLEMQCGAYRCDTDGVRLTGRMGEEIVVIRHPILPVRRIVDVDTGEQRMQLAYCRVEAGKKAEWQDITASRETLASAQRVISLARNGVGVTSENAKELVKYLSEMESLNYSAMDTQRSTGHMGWLPDGDFAPYTDKVVFGGESDEFASLYANMHEAGSEAAWMEIARGVRNGKSVPARIALAASFAAPLVQKLGALSFFVHLWGLQGSGKTVALMLGASVWGNPLIGGYIKSFSGTKVSQELYAAFCGNLPVFLDELQVISDRKSFDDLIYALCEGVSKGRGAKDGGLQTAKRWATVFMTTGEMPIVQSNSGGGAAVRTIEVNYGGEPFFEDARTAANALKQNYGFAGRRFIAALKKEENLTAVREMQKMFYGKLAGDIQDKQVLSASLLLAADALAEAEIFRDGKALTVEDIRPFLITQEQADVNQRCYQYLVGWIASNQKRFSKDEDENNGEPWGVFEKEPDRRSGTEREYAYIIRGVFERAMADGGFSPGAFLSWAKRKNLLRVSPSRPDRSTVQKTIGTQHPTCVAVLMPEDDEENQPVEVQDDEDMPF